MLWDDLLVGDELAHLSGEPARDGHAAPLPPELQSYIVFAGGVSAKSKAPDAARELIRFLKGPAVPVIRAQGMEPG